jgi:hypothetical protein
MSGDPNYEILIQENNEMTKALFRTREILERTKGKQSNNLTIRGKRLHHPSP